jgi:hypothetical protein
VVLSFANEQVIDCFFCNQAKWCFLSAIHANDDACSFYSAKDVPILGTCFCQELRFLIS